MIPQPSLPFATSASSRPFATSGSNPATAAPPPYSPFPVEPQLSVGQAATLAFNKLHEVGYDPRNRKPILECMIRIHNAMAENSADRLVLAEQDDFTARYPKLDKWIETKLAFLDIRKVIQFAFVSGHLSEYYEAEDFCRGKVDETRIDFFRRYFSQEGKDAGVAKLDLLESTNIIYQKDIACLYKAYDGCTYLEPITASEESVVFSQFNFPVAFRVLSDACTQWKDVARKMLEIFSEDYVRKIETECKGNVTKAMLTVLHKIACSGKQTNELVNVLTNIGRKDLSEKLEEALQRP